MCELSAWTSGARRINIQSILPFSAILMDFPSLIPVHCVPCKHLLRLLLKIDFVTSLPSSFCVFVPSMHSSKLSLKCSNCNISCHKVILFVVPYRLFSLLQSNTYNIPNNAVKKIMGKIAHSAHIFMAPLLGAFDIDFGGCRLFANILFKHMIFQEANSWLSTLGGGFSSLGDKFEDAAEIAGAISLRQMRLASSTKIPAFQARCRLFYAQSLMQCGQLHAAKTIIRMVYKFCQNASVYENPPELHLRLMCLGLWSRLKFLWMSCNVKKQGGSLSLSAARKRALLDTSSEPQDFGFNLENSELSTKRLFPNVADILDNL